MNLLTLKLTRLLLAFAVTCLPYFLSAQNITVKGKITDAASGKPIENASIAAQKNSKNGTVSNAEGEFALTVPKGEKIVISVIGFELKVVPANSSNLDISLIAGSQQLSDVVVTALGIKKDKKKLGYALQEVKGEQLTTARETNVVSQLAGKVAGVTVVGSNSGIGGSARVSIRGERSVDLNKNQPLYVIDGVPVSNAISGGSGRGNLEVDFGNGAGFINPDDIESLTVLKGPAAAALYGSRAANGVILIKSKAGKAA